MSTVEAEVPGSDSDASFRSRCERLFTDGGANGDSKSSASFNSRLGSSVVVFVAFRRAAPRMTGGKSLGKLGEIADVIQSS
jgi:hypothetical protein